MTDKKKEHMTTQLPQRLSVQASLVSNKKSYVAHLEKQEGHGNKAIGWHCVLEMDGILSYVGKEPGPSSWSSLLQRCHELAATLSGHRESTPAFDTTDWR